MTRLPRLGPHPSPALTAPPSRARLHCSLSRERLADAEPFIGSDGFSCNCEQEIRMKTLLAFVITMWITATPSPGRAQETPSPAAGPPDAAAPANSPEERGTTGWKGGAREQDKDATIGAGAQKKSDEELAADQPLMATGVDLNGPPRRFPPNKTPE